MRLDESHIVLGEARCDIISAMTIRKTRAGGVCVVDGKILLIQRINLLKEGDAREYYVIPGGGVEIGETVEAAVVREMKEEADVDIHVGDLFYEMEDKSPGGDDRKHYYHLCEYVAGEPRLREDSEEAIEMKEGVQFYKPMWLGLEEFKNVTLFPKEIKEKIIERFE